MDELDDKHGIARCGARALNGRNANSAGRPTRQEAHALTQKIVTVAAHLIARDGYETTSIEAIAREAGVAKRTVYSRFDGKQQLLEAALQQVAARLLPPLDGIESNAELSARLTALGFHVLSYASSDEAVQWVRLISRELTRIPQLAQMVEEVAVRPLSHFVETLLTEAVEHQVLLIPDISFAAQVFLQVVTAPAQQLATRGMAVGTEAEIRQHVRKTVDFFMHAYSPARTSL